MRPRSGCASSVSRTAVVTSLEQTGKVEREIAIDSPASGFIIERNALPNAYVQPDTKLYTIADLSTVWVYANVFQDAVGRLRPGDPAQVTVDAYPGREFNGRVDQILPQVDPATRTVRVRLIFRNPGVVLKPGMYVNVDINFPLGKQLVIPASAVLQSGSRAIAFIDHGDGNLEPREIQTGPQIDDSVIVLKGLQPGDHIVSSANFLVDSEAQLQAALGSFTPPQQNANPAAHSRRLQFAARTNQDRDDDRAIDSAKRQKHGAHQAHRRRRKTCRWGPGFGHVLYACHAGDGYGRRSAQPLRSAPKVRAFTKARLSSTREARGR